VRGLFFMALRILRLWHESVILKYYFRFLFRMNPVRNRGRVIKI